MDIRRAWILVIARTHGHTAIGRALLCAVAATLLVLSPDASVAGDQGIPRWAAKPYAAAVASFRAGRFPEAYGRFVAIAEGGYAPAARHALWMCESGQELFGSAFDCAPHEIQGWAALAGVDPDEALRRIYPALPRRVVAAVRLAR